MKNLSQEEKNSLFISKARLVHRDKFDYSKVHYIKSSEKIDIICPTHGIFKQTPNNHLRGQGCPKCKYELQSLQKRQTKASFIEKANTIHNNKYDYSLVEYINNRTPVRIICPQHGEFIQIPHDHVSGCGCPKCRLVGQALLYNKLKSELPNLKILFEVGNRTIPWIGNQRIDIYIPKLNIAIEYNGRQHYTPVNRFGGVIEYQKRLELDNLKRQKCKENNCILFEVKFDYTKEDFNKLINNIKQIYYENNT